MAFKVTFVRLKSQGGKAIKMLPLAAYNAAVSIYRHHGVVTTDKDKENTEFSWQQCCIVFPLPAEPYNLC